jgi:adenine-specific DNA-methyltransferase
VFHLINDDCINAMQSLPSQSINLAITSPPYNAGKAYEDISDLDAYLAFADHWIGEVSRLLTEDGGFWINVGYWKTSPKTTTPITYFLHPIALRHGLHLVQEVVWHYEGGLTYKRRFAHRTERWMWLAKDPKSFVWNLDAVRDPTLNRTRSRLNNPLGKNPTDYWYYDRVVGGSGASAEKTDHPCQFPVKMIERIVKACSNEGQTIIDPFGGSGTTAEAAVRNKRHAISIERDPTYHAISEGRLRRVSLNPVAGRTTKKPGE